MTDPISSVSELLPEAGERRSARQPAWELIELLFFAYRDFVGDADDALAPLGFGRAHHRVLHFVNRNPGMKVAELLDLLRITKQSLARVLKQLVDEGYVTQRIGSDRRQRLLFVTAKGEALAQKLAQMQTARIERALRLCPSHTAEAAKAFLSAMVGGESGIPTRPLAQLGEVRHIRTGTG